MFYMVEQICKRCGKPFQTKPFYIRKGFGNFCSQKCYHGKSIDKKCLYCGNTFHTHSCKLKVGKGKYCSRECYSKAQKELLHSPETCFKKGENLGENNNLWKGGKSSSNGYILIYQPHHPKAIKGRYVREHILVAEKALNRFLNEKEIIHHINGIKSDNRLENLYLFPDNGSHCSYHYAVKRGEIKEIEKTNLTSV